MATTYQAPGVYVIEDPSGSAPIAGVGTSTAGFIGVFGSGSSSTPVPTSTQPTFEDVGREGEPVEIGTGDGNTREFDLPKPANLASAEVVTDSGFKFFVGGRERTAVTLKNEGNRAIVTFQTAPGNEAKITGFFRLRVPAPVTAPVSSNGGSSTTVVAAPIATPDLAAAGEVKLCTNFSEFKKFFGEFSTNPGQNLLAHAVFGFFRNGGTRCFVVQVNQENDIRSALGKFEAIDEIAIVAAPGITTKSVLVDINDHCKNLGDRVAIFDTPENVADDKGNLNTALLEPTNAQKVIPDNSDYAALYFPWIQVFDPASGKNKYVPPSGHIAGIYARVDTQRGVFKAPANETVLGAIGLKYDISKNHQQSLNPNGINCIRSLNGNIRVWGARTLGGDGNGEFKYINVRRLFNYLRESIDEGTQWTVFEPNAPDLWARIRRNINAFLLMAWRSGALFGTTPEQAFFVKCDEETNPPEVRDAGQVVTEIGVAVVKPAEFVIFRIKQWAGPGGS